MEEYKDDKYFLLYPYIAADMMEKKEISLHAFVLYCTMCNNSSINGDFSMSARDMCKLLECNTQAVSNAKKSLAIAGLVSIIEEDVGRGKPRHVYKINKL